jgi:hypothetical protein
MMSQEVRVPVIQVPRKASRRMSLRFYRISGLVLLALLAVLVVLLLLKP